MSFLGKTRHCGWLYSINSRKTSTVTERLRLSCFSALICNAFLQHSRLRWEPSNLPFELNTDSCPRKECAEIRESLIQSAVIKDSARAASN